MSHVSVSSDSDSDGDEEPQRKGMYTSKKMALAFGQLGQVCGAQCILNVDITSLGSQDCRVPRASLH